MNWVRLFSGEFGQLGTEIKSEQEFSLLYQLFADEELGSGQFGTVYGGKIVLLPLLIFLKRFNWWIAQICVEYYSGFSSPFWTKKKKIGYIGGFRMELKKKLLNVYVK